MNCNKAKGEIDQLYLNHIKQISAAANRHIADCPSCSEFYQSTRLASQLSNKLKSATPVLNNPEQLTDSIMLDIKQEMITKRKVFTSLNFQRLLAAASICLFIVFGIEQYNVLAKINRLETNNQSISRSSEPANLNGSLEGFLFIKYNILKKNSPKYFENLKLDQYSKREILASLNQLGVSSFSLNEIRLFMESNRASFDNKQIEVLNNSEPGIPGSLLPFKN